MAKEQNIKSLMDDSNYVILNNPLANPKFIKSISEKVDSNALDKYTPKIFYEIVSQLTSEAVEKLRRTENIIVSVNITKFRHKVHSENTNNSQILISFVKMQKVILTWEQDDRIISTAIVVKTDFNKETGIVDLYIDSDMAKQIIAIKEIGNFSFLKSTIFALQTTHAIKLYPFFKSWLRHGKYKSEINRFREMFGYLNSGYDRFKMFEERVLIPAVLEINQKTDIHLSYIKIGTNIESTKPRIKELEFIIKENAENKKSKQKDNNLKIEQLVEIEKEDSLIAKKQEFVTEELKLTPEGKSKTPDLILEEAIAIIKLIDSNVEQRQLDKIIEKVGSIRLWEMAIESKKEHANKPIKNIIGFLISGQDILGLGNYDKSLKTKEQQQKRHELNQMMFNKKETLDKIIVEYAKFHDARCVSFLDNLNIETKKDALEKLYESGMFRHIYFNEGKLEKPNLVAITDIAQRLNFDKYDRKKEIIAYAKEHHNFEIGYNHEGDLIPL